MRVIGSFFIVFAALTVLSFDLVEETFEGFLWGGLSEVVVGRGFLEVGEGEGEEERMNQEDEKPESEVVTTEETLLRDGKGPEDVIL